METFGSASCCGHEPNAVPTRRRPHLIAPAAAASLIAGPGGRRGVLRGQNPQHDETIVPGTSAKRGQEEDMRLAREETGRLAGLLDPEPALC